MTLIVPSKPTCGGSIAKIGVLGGALPTVRNEEADGPFSTPSLGVTVTCHSSPFATTPAGTVSPE